MWLFILGVVVGLIAGVFLISIVTVGKSGDSK